MSIYLVLGSALWLGVLTSISPCPLATNIAAITFLGRSAGRAWRVLASGLLYTLGRTLVYVALGVLILRGFQMAGQAGAAGSVSRWLQTYMNLALGPALILIGMLLLGLLEVRASLSVGGKGLQDRVAEGGALWSFPLGVLFALSFCPVSAALFFGSLIGLSSRHASPVLLPTLYGIGTAVPVIAFAILIAFASRHVAKAFGGLRHVERWGRVVTGCVFVAAGIYYTLRYVYGL